MDPAPKRGGEMSELKIDCSRVGYSMVNFLREEFMGIKIPPPPAILGLSGGLDSGVVAFLSKRAELDLFVVLMPYGFLSEKDTRDAERIVAALGLPSDRVITAPITSSVDAKIQEELSQFSLSETAVGNIMARERMVTLRALANHFNGLVVGTGNASEYYLGYFTTAGDAEADIYPLGLWKTQVYQLARYLGVPAEIIDKKPSAGLFAGQTDEGELGFSYEEADPILYLFIIRGASAVDIVERYGYSQDLTERVIGVFERTKYKRAAAARFSLYRKTKGGRR